MRGPGVSEPRVGGLPGYPFIDTGDASRETDGPRRAAHKSGAVAVFWLV